MIPCPSVHSMITGKTITLVVPCRNEASALFTFLQKIPCYVDEILVVDNNSSDKTSVIARGGGAKVLTERKQLNGIGYGFAHQRGLREARGDYIVALDGDDTYPVEHIQRIIKYMQKRSLDFVSCNRLPLKEKAAISRIRQLGIKILNAQISALYGYKFNDILTGMWIMKKEVKDKLTLQSGDWNLSIEIKLEARKNRTINFAEYHIPHFSRLKEQSKQNIWKTGLEHFWYVVWRRVTIDNPLRESFAYRVKSALSTFLSF